MLIDTVADYLEEHRVTLVIGGHGEDAIDHLFEGSSHVEIRVERYGSGAPRSAPATGVDVLGVSARCR